MVRRIFTELLPPRCLVCGSREPLIKGVCSLCRSQILPIPEPTCDRCGSPCGTVGVCLQCQSHPPPFDKMVSAAVFDGLIKDIIHVFKYRKATVYKKFLAHLLFDALTPLNLTCDVLTFVPLHWTRMITRGYNQAALIAQELSGYLETDVRYDVIRKTRKTASQVGLKGRDRKRNIHGAFAARGVDASSVMVVDDVITTGQTAYEISRALKNAGASRIVFVSIGRIVS
ncbi:MAG: ComF family protein [Desulfomonilia bacterium]